MRGTLHCISQSLTLWSVKSCSPFTDEDVEVKPLAQGHKLEKSGIRVTIKFCLVEPSILSHLATENEWISRMESLCLLRLKCSPTPLEKEKHCIKTPNAWAQVPSLVKDLRSCMPRGMTKNLKSAKPLNSTNDNFCRFPPEPLVWALLQRALVAHGSLIKSQPFYQLLNPGVLEDARRSTSALPCNLHLDFSNTNILSYWPLATLHGFSIDFRIKARLLIERVLDDLVPCSLQTAFHPW